MVPACEYAVVARPLGGESQSGDASLVQATDHGLLVAVVDGLGHGEEAAAAAEAAIEVFREHAGLPLATLFQRCHERLQATRGAAVVLAALDSASATLTWAGVGNVEALLVAALPAGGRARQWLTNRGGVVGYRLPAVEPRVVPIRPGDLLILATDGIDERFGSEQIPSYTPDELAHAILERHGKATDDALVLVLRWLGGHFGDASGSVR